jgi:ketosteroid isomerase-like protein
MSRENIEVVRRIYDAAARGDSSAVLSLYDPEVEWSPDSRFGGLGGEAVYRGHEGLRRFFREWHGAWETVEHSYGEMVDAGDHVIVRDTSRGRGRTSGVEVVGSQYAVWTLREGKVIRVEFFATRREALEAVGLRE